MFRVHAGPEAEPVVVLAGEDQGLHAGILQGFHPLLRIKSRWIEYGGIFITITPFLVGKGIGGKMDEGILLQFVPGKLLIVRQRANRGRGRHLA